SASTQTRSKPSNNREHKSSPAPDNRLNTPRGRHPLVRVAPPTLSDDLIRFACATALRPASFGSVARRFGDEGFEELHVLSSLGVPEDAEGEAMGGILDRFDGAVFGMRRSAQSCAEPAEALVVVRLHRHGTPVAEQAGELRARVDDDVVIRELAGCVF